MTTFVFTSPEGKKYRVNGPEGATQSEAFSILQKQIKPKGISERVSDDLSMRKDERKQISDRAAGNMLPQSGGLQLLGNLAGTVGDVIGEGLVSAFRALPDSLENKIRTKAEETANLPLIKAGVKKYGEFKGKHPEAAENVEAVGNILSIATPVKGSSVVSTGTKAVTTPVKAAKKGVGDIISRLTSPASEKAEKKVLQRLDEGGMNPDIASRALANTPAGKERAIIDVGGENIERLGEAVSTIPGKGADMATDFVVNRASGRSSRVLDDISEAVSKEVDYFDLADEVMKDGRKAAAPVYEKAYKVNIKPSPKLNELLARPASVKAMENARIIAENEGVDLAKSPNTLVYDYMKRGFDDILQGYKNEVTGKLDLDTQGRAIQGLKSDFVSEVKRLNPTYKQALKESSGYLEEGQALSEGYDFLKADPEILKRKLSQMSKSEKKLFKVGVAKKLREQVNDMSDGRDIVKKIFGDQDTRNRLNAILPGKEYAKLQRRLFEEQAQFRREAKLTGNSRTELRRQETTDLGIGGLEAGAAALTGGKTAMIKAAIGPLWARFSQGMKKDTAEEVAKILFETDPKKQAQILKRLKARADKGDPKAVKSLTVYETFINNTAGPAGILSGREALTDLQETANEPTIGE